MGVQFEFNLLLSEACYTTRGEGERKSQHGVSYLMLPAVSGPINMALM